MVQFPASHFLRLLIERRMTGIQTCRVTPFGYPGIKGCLLLTLAFRSLPRPSSSDSAKASAMDPFSLDHIIKYPIPIHYVKEQRRPRPTLEAWGIEPQTFSLQS